MYSKSVDRVGRDSAIPVVTVVVVAYNCSHQLENALRSLSGEAAIQNVVVVDNSEDTIERDRTELIAEDYDALYVAMDRNVGFGPAVNLGVAAANPADQSLLWILNPDTIVLPGALDRMIYETINGPADIVSPTIITGPSKDRIWFAGGVINVGNRSVRHHGMGESLDRFVPAAQLDVSFITGAAMMMTVSVWRALGGFDERIFLYWEDVDLCIRARELGFRLGVSADAVVWHEVGGSSAGIGKSATYYYWMQRNRIVVLGSRYGRWPTAFGRGSVETLRLFSRAARESDGRRRKVVASVRGLIDAMKLPESPKEYASEDGAITKTSFPKRVMVLWADNNSANLGVRVLAAGAQEAAVRVWGPATEVVFQDFGGSTTGVALGTRAILQDFGRPNGPIKRHFRRFDAVLDTGAGDSFTDIYGFKRLFMMAYSYQLLHRQKVPVVMVPQTIGPFTTKLGRIVGRLVLSRMKYVMARDAVSSECASSLGRPVDTVSTDLVFMLPQPERSSNYDVVFNVSGLLWVKNSHVNHVQYQTWVRATLQGLLESGREVTLLAHVIESTSLDNDVPVVRALQSEFSSQGVQALVPRDLSEARSAIAGSKLVVASRMHACLNALSMGVPAVAWAYSRKFEPLMASLKWKYVVDLKSCEDVAESTLRWSNDLVASSSEKVRLEAGILTRSALDLLLEMKVQHEIA